jgi:hypothetical protein
MTKVRGAVGEVMFRKGMNAEKEIGEEKSGVHKGNENQKAEH